MGPERHGPTGSRANRHRAVCIASEHRAVLKDMSGRKAVGYIRSDTGRYASVAYIIYRLIKVELLDAPMPM